MMNRKMMNKYCAFLFLSILTAFSFLLLMSCKPQAKQPLQNVSRPAPVPASSYRNISSDDLYRTYTSNNWKIIDIRTKEEFNRGHLPNAILFPWSEFSAENFSKYGLEYDDNLIIYCNSGVRSLPPSKMLAEHGYKNVFNLLDGILGWPYPINR